MSKNKKSLAETHPELAKQWHPSKNGDLTPYDVTLKSGKKVWWKCDNGYDHEWKSSISNRKQGYGCPICSGRKAVKSNCLATLNPEVAKQWHPTKNGNLTPYDIRPKSNRKVWWKCDKGNDHEWKANPNNVSKGYKSGCPMCSGKKFSVTNSLLNINPELAKQWHRIKNGELTPKNVKYNSGKKVWWKCPEGNDHVWESSISHRNNGSGCPMCSGRKAVKSNCLAKINPKVAKQWHPTNNGNLSPEDVTLNSSKKVWWKCSKGDDHEWESPINNITNGSGCPVCRNIKVVKSNSLATVEPELSKQWHPTKNGKLNPHNVSHSNQKVVWWKCDNGYDHEWKSSIWNRKQGYGCRICAGKKIVKSNCLATLNPEVAKQWHPTKNGNLSPEDVTLNSGKKVWWKCSKGDDHEWKVSINARSGLNSNCPYCTLTPQSKQELTITFELMKLFKNIDPKGLKTKLKGRLRSIDIFIPKLNLCIEFDGSYWHKDKRDIDKIKSEMLFEEGFKLIRVREEPLKKIYDTDVISKQPYNGKQVTNDILSMILSIFELDSTLVFKIKAYQSKEGLQNEKGLEKYIDKILTEKAEKKR